MNTSTKGNATSTNTEKTETSADSKSKGKKATPKEKLAKPKKQPWTLEMILREGRQFHSESEWYSQSPASFKSAMAHGWVAQALGASSTQSASNVVRMPTRKSSTKSKPLKKAA